MDKFEDFVFIGGTGRSGTSIFKELICQHPDVWSFRWESQLYSGVPGLGDLVNSNFDMKFFDRFKSRVVGHLFKRNVRGVYDAGLFEIISFDDLQSHLNNFENTLVDRNSSIAQKLEACADLGRNIFYPVATQSNPNTKIICEKTPRNLLYADLIQKIHPKAKFIHVVRDGRDVISSILKRKFWPVARCNRYPETLKFGGEFEFENALMYWTTLIDIFSKQEKIIGQKQWLTIRYEDILFDLEGTFRKIYEFIGLDYDSTIYDLQATKIRPNSCNFERWKKELSDDQISKFMKISSENLEKYSYI